MKTVLAKNRKTISYIKSVESALARIDETIAQSRHRSRPFRSRLNEDGQLQLYIWTRDVGYDLDITIAIAGSEKEAIAEVENQYDTTFGDTDWGQLDVYPIAPFAFSTMGY